jgi:DNA-binding NarL/FixJ family response regulator
MWESTEVLIKAIRIIHVGVMWIDRGATGRIFQELARQTAARHAHPEVARIDQLTTRERHLVITLASDASAPGKVLAQRLHISEHTLRNHLTSIYRKLGVANRTELYAFAHRNGLARM